VDSRIRERADACRAVDDVGDLLQRAEAVRGDAEGAQLPAAAEGEAQGGVVDAVARRAGDEPQLVMGQARLGLIDVDVL